MDKILNPEMFMKNTDYAHFPEDELTADFKF